MKHKGVKWNEVAWCKPKHQTGGCRHLTNDQDNQLHLLARNSDRLRALRLPVYEISRLLGSTSEIVRKGRIANCWPPRRWRFFTRLLYIRFSNRRRGIHWFQILEKLYLLIYYGVMKISLLICSLI